jgi:hypothetical protein
MPLWRLSDNAHLLRCPAKKQRGVGPRWPMIHSPDIGLPAFQKEDRAFWLTAENPIPKSEPDNPFTFFDVWMFFRLKPFFLDNIFSVRKKCVEKCHPL